MSTRFASRRYHYITTRGGPGVLHQDAAQANETPQHFRVRSDPLSTTLPKQSQHQTIISTKKPVLENSQCLKVTDKLQMV
jgi:hypothetical protein